MNPLLAIYPRAVLSDTCCTAEDVFCFYDEKRRVYAAIPKEDITPKEKLLLESFLTPAEEKGVFSGDGGSKEVAAFSAGRRSGA